MADLTLDDATEIVRTAIADVAPDVAADLQTIDPSVDLWDTLELDSMDHQNVMVAIAERTGVEIAERDYPALRSLGRLAAHLTAAPSP